jgi:hypothetical protein
MQGRWPLPGDVVIGNVALALPSKGTPATPWLNYLQINVTYWNNGTPDAVIVQNGGYGPGYAGNPLLYLGWSATEFCSGQAVQFTIAQDEHGNYYAENITAI